MRSVACVLGAVVLTAPLLAAEPSESEVKAVFALYRAAVCTNSADCPPSFTDIQARIRLLKQYCDNQGAGPDCATIRDWDPLPALIYDHEKLAWRAEPAIEKRTELDVNGMPTTDLGPGESLVVVVENTNPLLYTATPGKTELKAIDQFSDLQALAGLLGGNAAALLQASANERGLTEREGVAEGTSSSVIDEAANALRVVGADFVAAQTLADCVTLRVQAATAFVQAVEVKRPDTYPSDLLQCRGLDSSARAVRSQAVPLSHAQATVVGRCVELPAAVEALLTLEPLTLDSVKVRLRSYVEATSSPKCWAWDTKLPGHNATVKYELDRLIVDRIQQEIKNPRPDLPGLYNELKEELEGVQTLVLAVKATKEVEAALVKLIDKLPALAKAAENLDLFRERLIQNVAGPVVPCGDANPPPCVPQSSVATFIVVPGDPSEVRKWEFVHSRSIKIAADSPYVADVVARRSGVDTSYYVRSPLASIFDIGVSVTQTDLRSPTFGAIREDPENFTNSNQVVGIIDEESQSGKIALMLNVVPLRLWDVPKLVQPLGLQIGASTDTSKPAYFWGISYGLGKYVRIGWGETAQRVTALRDETPLGSRIANKDEIRKRQKYEREEYWSLMVSLRTLRLFTR